ncbi:MAG: WxL domain-containing protein, partial [Lactococcus lactis]|nr:WxL domain-containing protein [Lactococcus lactis]
MVAICAILTVPNFFVEASEVYQTQGQIGFYAGTDVTPPVNPNIPDPNRPVFPQNPDGSLPNPGTQGPLSIDFASSLDFGINPISNKDEIYFAKAQSYTESTTETPNYVQVTDNRGTLMGWTLSVTEKGQLT